MSTLFKRLVLLMALLSVSLGARAEYLASDTVAVRAAVEAIFNAMRAGDSESLKLYILPEAPLDRISPNKPIEHGTVAQWVDWVATLKPGQADEQVFDLVVNVEGPLATVWAPFTISIDGVLTSCGVNHFTFVKTDEVWKVAYLIDTHTPEKCLTE